MTVIENCYQRILDSKCSSSIRKQIVEFYNSTWTPKAISPQLEAKIVALRAFFRKTTDGEKITVRLGEEMAETACDYGISEEFKTTYFNQFPAFYLVIIMSFRVFWCGGEFSRADRRRVLWH